METGINFLTAGLCFFLGNIIFGLVIGVYAFRIAWNILHQKKAYLPFVVTFALMVIRSFTGASYIERRAKELLQPKSLSVIGRFALLSGVIVLLFTVYLSYDFYQFLTNPVDYITR